MPAIERVDRAQFKIDFVALKRSLLPFGRKLTFSARMLQLDPQLILESVRRIMGFCDMHDGLGNRLVWNEYKVFLSREDHEEFVNLEPVLFAQADELLHAFRKEIEAEIIGDMTLRLLVDDSFDLAPHTAMIQTVAKVNRELDDERLEVGEITIRLPAEDVTPAPPSVPEDSLTEPAPLDAISVTERLPQSAERLTLRWDGGSVAIQPGVRWIVGRATETPVAEHCIPLSGASTRVSSRAFWIEAKEEGATIGRFDHDTANAVQVKGELLMRGGEIWVYEFPATIRLTNGEMELSLERA